MSNSFTVRPVGKCEGESLLHNEEQSFKDVEVPEHLRCVVAVGIPDKVTLQDLKVLFSSHARGGGPLESIDIKCDDNGNRIGVLTFEEYAGMFFIYFLL